MIGDGAGERDAITGISTGVGEVNETSPVMSKNS
jgi:hypothetical protein